MAQTVTLTDGRTVTFPDGMSREDMASALSQVPPLEAPHDQQAENPNAPAPMRNGRPVIRIDRASLPSARAGKPSDILPIAGGMGGAVLGGLTSAVTGPVGPAFGAAIGGGAGKALQSLVDGQSPDAGDVIRTGLSQGAMQATAPVLELAAKGLYRGGVALLPKSIKAEYPNLAQSGYREGVALTRRGANKAERLIGESRQEADDLLAAAQQGGAGPVKRFAVVDELRPVAQKTRMGARLGRTDETQAVTDRASAFLRRNPRDLSLTDAQAMKREAQDLATAAYKAQARGATINSTETLMDDATARGLRKGIERVVPAVGPINTRTQDLIGLSSAADHAAQTGHVLSRLGGAGVFGSMAGPAGVVPALLGAGAGAAMTTPGGLTATGLALKPIAAHLPDAVRVAMLLSLLSGEQQDQ